MIALAGSLLVACQGRDGEREKYAALIAGLDTHRECRFVEGMSKVYQVLLEHGFKRENIRVLGYNKPDDPCSYQSKRPYPIHGLSTKKNVRDALYEIGELVDGNDLLFVFTIDHGEKTPKSKQNSNTPLPERPSNLALADGHVDQGEFNSYLAGINPSAGIFLFDHCFSGGFAEDLSIGNYVAIASSRDDEPGYIGEGADSVSGFLMQAFSDKGNSDRDGNGRVSIREAFDYMRECHMWTRDGEQHPIIRATVDPRQIYLE